ncbi:MAG: hypothetical protein V7K40_02580 [Nostoc sp.]|uniref:ISAzo13-like element transposase-related protein n=1 Tax=Nostoc sp. TaxID=1180 RepID=UPI002FFA78B9
MILSSTLLVGLSNIGVVAYKGSVDTVLQFASTLTFKGKNPVVTLVEQIYHTKVKLTQQAMAEVEKQIYRLPSLKKWFVEIFCRSD